MKRSHDPECWCLVIKGEAKPSARKAEFVQGRIVEDIGTGLL
jgi:hypothetical protein